MYFTRCPEPSEGLSFKVNASPTGEGVVENVGFRHCGQLNRVPDEGALPPYSRDRVVGVALLVRGKPPDIPGVRCSSRAFWGRGSTPV